MKKAYLILSIIGFILPNFFVMQESISSGNVLLWLDPGATLAAMFGTTISTAFIVDLLLVVIVFFVWTYYEAKKLSINNIGWLWMFTMLFGLACTFPYFLYLSASKLERSNEISG